MKVYVARLQSTSGSGMCIDEAKFADFRDAVDWVYEMMDECKYGYRPKFGVLYCTLNKFGKFPVIKDNVSYNSVYVFIVTEMEIDLE